MTKEESIQREIEIKTTLIFSLADIQEGLVTDIISLLQQKNIYKFSMKKRVNAIKHDTEVFRQEFNEVFGNQEDKQILFGESTDRIKEIIFKTLNL